MDCRRFQSTIRLVSGILLMINKASCFYNQSYNGYTLFLPNIVMDHSSSKPIQLPLSEAQEWCTDNVDGSTLATIPNKDVQGDISDFLERAVKTNKHVDISRNINIRVNSIYHVTDEWRWVNDHPKGGIRVHGNDEKSFYSFHAYLKENDFSIHSDKPNTWHHFICEYPGNSDQCDLTLNGRCYKKNHYWLNWYDARNNCSNGGGDLASFETLNDTNLNVTLKNLSQHSFKKYWIGLQKNEWRWVDNGSAIKYTNWFLHPPFNASLQCLCLEQYLWTWKGCDCSKPYPFICLLKDMSESSTPRSSTSNETSDSSAQTHSGSSTSMETKTTEFIIITVSCAAIFVVIVIIAAVLIIKKRRNNEAPRAVKSSGYESPKCAMTESSMDFPLYAEIQKPKETNSASDTTYASVQMTSKSDEGFPVNNIVYAELDLTSRA